MKNKGTIITVSVCLAIIIAVAIYFFVIRKKKTTSTSGTTPSSGSSSSSTPPTVAPTAGLYTDSNYPLRQGSGGNRVKALQSGLNLTFASGLDIDGKFGSKTEAACRICLNTASITQADMGRLKIDDKYRQYV